MFVSVIIDSYNYGGFLKRAIDSVLGQSYTNLELIIVDDGSTDNSRSIIENVCGNDERVIPYFKDYIMATRSDIKGWPMFATKWLFFNRPYRVKT